MKPLSVRTTTHLQSLIEPADPSDPIARQFLISEEESVISDQELIDPVGDSVVAALPRLYHKYPDRVLIKVVASCAAYCRFCFRREAIGLGDGVIDNDELQGIVDYIQRDRQIWEVILSGGDPLMLNAERLATILAALRSVPHLKTVRIHTRIPIVDPDRIHEDVVAILSRASNVWLSVHCNHARELTPKAIALLSKFADGWIPLVSQTVLLRTVNDDPPILEELFRSLITSRVKPYYLHHCDLARGTSHFRTTLHRGQEIMRTLRGRLSGICLPTYVIDIPGGFGKIPVEPDWVEYLGEGSWILTDFRGAKHPYKDVCQLNPHDGLYQL